MESNKFSKSRSFPWAGAALLWVFCGCATSWQDKLARDLPVLGHRNWMVVADAAYPSQCRQGIETIATGTGQIEALRTVLEAIDRAEHLRAIVFLDAELFEVPETDAPGIEAYRKELSALLKGRPQKPVPHERIIAMLDDAAQTFTVLLFKTTMTLPYTSVFLQLDCGYWSAEAEERLRKSFGK